MNEQYANNKDGKLEWLLNCHYNMFHADMIWNAMHDDNISIQDFMSGCVAIHKAESEDDDEFTPKEFGL